MILDDWDALVRTLVAWKMNAFDLVVTVALGSTLATILVNKDPTCWCATERSTARP